MILDANLQLSNAQAVTATAMSVNNIDMGPPPPGASNPMAAVVTVDESVAAAGAATVAFEIVSSAASHLSSPTVLASSGAVPKADLGAGRAPIPIKTTFSDMPAGHRYVGMRYVVATGPLTAGKFTCHLTDHSINTGAYYPSGFSVA